MNAQVVVGLSGGVDSAVAAWLLLQQGYAVRAVFMRNWEDDGSGYCTAHKDFIDACRVADFLGIELTHLNFTEQYRQKVFAACIELFRCGWTPNPDVWCNSQIKFGVFLDTVADRADWIATGHYARIGTSGEGGAKRYILKRAIDASKDQSYFLHQLDQSQLSRILFPLGTTTKRAIRAQAKHIGLPNHDRPDSTGICFIGERPFAAFLQEFLPIQQGEIVDEEGRVLGQHKGLHFYTIGQRKGLQIGGSRHSTGLPWYVTGKDIANNQLIVVQGETHQSLYADVVYLRKPHWISGMFESFGVDKKADLYATIRYRQQPQRCSVHLDSHAGESGVSIRFQHPQKAITPGQFAVVYKGDECLGGGMICGSARSVAVPV